jgi:hypothetical protein
VMRLQWEVGTGCIINRGTVLAYAVYRY